jgi:hypothetical protein
MLWSMKNHFNSRHLEGLRALPLLNRIFWNQGAALVMFLFILVINALRVPSGVLNFWAEDGVVFYSDVMNVEFPQRLFVDSGGGGYLNLSGKLIAEGVRFFPIDIAPVINFIIVNLVYTILIVVIYNRLHAFFAKKAFLFLFIGFFVFVPIASYDSLATSINLHFFLVFTCLVILLTNEIKPSLVSHAIVLVTCLSDPLAILLTPSILFLILYKKIYNSHQLTFILSLVLQIVFILNFFGESTRVVGQNPSILKTSYLFMDRVVGSSLIPKWGFIDGQISESGEIPKVLYMRFFLSLIVLCLVVSIVILAKSKNRNNFKYFENSTVTLILFTSIFYWVVAGVFFNPEPRYAILPSLCLVLAFLMSLDSFNQNLKSNIVRQYSFYTTTFLLVSIFLSAFTVSDIRNTDLIWSEQLAAGKIVCDNSKRIRIEIKIPPEKNDLSLMLNCKYLR